MKTFTLVLALCAMLAVAHAADVDTTVELANNKKHAKHGGYGYDEKEHKHEKRFDIFPGEAETCNGDTRECGETFGLSRPMFADEELTKPVGVLFQTAVVALTGETDQTTRLIHQQSFRFTGANGFGEGTIQTQGDDTNFADSSYTNRAIIGGTGVFTGVSGYLTRGGNPTAATPTFAYTFVLTTVNKDYYKEY